MTKTYIVKANRTLYFVDATSIEAAAAEILNVDTPNRSFDRGLRNFSNAKGRKATEHCSVFLSLEEINDSDFFDRTIEASTIRGIYFPAIFIQGLAA